MKTPKQLYGLQAGLYLLASLLGSTSFYFAGPNPPKLSKLEGAVIIGGILLLAAAFYFVKYLITPKEAQFYDISKQAPEEQIVVSKRIIWVMLLLCPVLAYMTNRDILAFEAGESRSLKDWKPILYLYEHFGRKAAVSGWLVGGAFIVLLCGLRIQKARMMIRQLEDEEQESSW